MFDQMADDELPTPPWRTAPKPAPTRAPLRQEAIVDAALKILDVEGIDAVSMRRVADVLGTGAASLYQHVSGKDELLELAFDRVAAEIALPEPDAARWPEQVRELMTSTWKALRAHPGIAAVSIARIPTGPNAIAVSDVLVGILRAGHLPPTVCAWATDNLFKFVTADAFEEGVHLARGEPDELAYYEQIRDYFLSLPPGRFPHITAIGGALFEGDAEERFDFGLDLMIRGLRTYAEPG
jgi:AcrR family transcriptional regulator